jgi:hypothetical protein
MAFTAQPHPHCWSLNAASALELVLHYLNSTMLDTSLIQIFALVPATVSQYMTSSLHILLYVLYDMLKAAIHWLQDEEFQWWNLLVLECYNLLEGAFGVMDGLNLAVQTSVDEEIKNATFNGWLYDYFVKCVIAFCSQGGILHVCKNWLMTYDR